MWGELRPHEEIVGEGQNPRQVSESHRKAAVREAGQREKEHGLSTARQLVRSHFKEGMVRRGHSS